MLLKNGIKAKLIQSNDGFNLKCLDEIRFFTNQLKTDAQVPVISDQLWENAKRLATAKFKTTDNWMMLENLIRDFELTNTKIKYKSDFEVFIRESKLEDFYSHHGETIFVSTIHKAKGKEFDNVFLMLEYYSAPDDDLMRQLYVAITRAKQNLTIHSNTGYFDNIHTTNINLVGSADTNPPPEQLAMHTTHKDVDLGYFHRTQKDVNVLKAGDDLITDGDELLDLNKRPILKFSRLFKQHLQDVENRGYKLVTAKVNFIIYWQQENTQQEIKIVLPRLYFNKTN